MENVLEKTPTTDGSKSPLDGSGQLSAVSSDVAAPADATPAKGDQDDRSTHFDFRNHVFKMPGARFCLIGAERTPIFCVELGDVEAKLQIHAMQREFSIEPSSYDGELIATAVKGLRYVPDIRPGDRIPSEILDGTASWRIKPKHREIAVQRLKAQLISWVSGQEILITNPEELEMYFDQIENKEKIKAAFSDAAELLGHERDDHNAVFEKINTLARELCYIEALRDKYNVIPMLAVKLDQLQKKWQSDRRLATEIQRIKLLMRRGIEEYTKIFEEIDAQTGEIASALKSIGAQVEHIRRVRDDLHFLIMSWEPLLVQWDQASPKNAYKMKLLLADTYRFLAGKFNTGKSLLDQH